MFDQFDDFDLFVETREPLQHLHEKIRQQHEEIRQQVEAACNHDWRVTIIKSSSTSLYNATLETNTQPAPDYILAQVLAEFDIYAVENGPIEKVIDGITVRLHLHKMTFKGYLLSTGKIRVIPGMMS